jgi:hypothetical protein
MPRSNWSKLVVLLAAAELLFGVGGGFYHWAQSYRGQRAMACIFRSSTTLHPCLW